MKQIGNVIISDSVWEAKFACDISRCKGKCCQYGDLGAPVTVDEAKNIKCHLKDVEPFISKKNMSLLKGGIVEIHKGNLHIKEGGKNTPCPLSFINENGIVMCSLHRYSLENNKPLLDYKPLWCSLYPLIIKPVADVWLINCSFNDFCVSVDNPPPLLLAFSDLLAELFGEKWVETVKEQLAISN